MTTPSDATPSAADAPVAETRRLRQYAELFAFRTPAERAEVLDEWASLDLNEQSFLMFDLRLQTALIGLEQVRELRRVRGLLRSIEGKVEQGSAGAKRTQSTLSGLRRDLREFTADLEEALDALLGEPTDGTSAEAPGDAASEDTDDDPGGWPEDNDDDPSAELEGTGGRGPDAEADEDLEHPPAAPDPDASPSPAKPPRGRGRGRKTAATAAFPHPVSE